MLDPNGIEVERLDRKDCIANFILRPNIIFYDPTSNLEQQKRVKLLAFTFARQLFAVDPIGSGVTESGGKVIFNQRMKQSGMRWSKLGGQRIVDLKTACRSGLWDRFWLHGIDIFHQLPDLDQRLPFQPQLSLIKQPIPPTSPSFFKLAGLTAMVFLP